ncbi:hypothetical protein MSAN_01121100 [Mycena sanguinolenta]|uniref:Uncharacterized protein n=1 Tax=Mycena sanguinolenta TaxID=230812 RepID=A0A8H7D696_9AGAR|nr:hypothetical protein MSAN_01121100 [Mycena sanguinolenta]
MQSTLFTSSVYQQKNILKYIESVVSSLFHMPDPKPTDVHVLAIVVLIQVVFHAVHARVLALASHTTTDWIQTVASFIKDNKVSLQEKAETIAAQVAAIIQEMTHRDVIPSWNPQHDPWRFSEENVTTLATELSQCVKANLM